MNILFVSENYYPQTSGVPVVVRYLAEGLVNKGHHVAVATQSHNNPIKEETLNGVIIYRFDIYKNIFKRPAGNTSEFISFVTHFEADATVVECTQCITTDLLLPYLKKIRGRKYFQVHGISGLTPGMRLFEIKNDFKHTIGNTYNYINSAYYFRFTLRKTIKDFNATMCLSEVDYGIDYLKSYARKNYILDNAADNMFFDKACCTRQVLQKYASLSNIHFFVSCANYTYIKNQKDIITQFYLSESSKNTSLVCIGSQPNEYYQNCLKHVEEMNRLYGKRDVHILYGVERNDIPSIINKAELYLVGSLWEQYSISIIEAMSQGVPFISTNVGNARILPGGITIDSIGDMHNCIDLLMDDKKLYQNYSEAGRKFAYDNCRIDVAVEKLEKIISKP